MMYTKRKCPDLKKKAYKRRNYILPFPKQALVFTCLHYKSFENTGKREIAGN